MVFSRFPRVSHIGGSVMVPVKVEFAGCYHGRNGLSVPSEMWMVLVFFFETVVDQGDVEAA